MAPETKASNGFLAHARDTGLHDELKKSSRVRQSLKKTNERLLSPRGTETIKYPDKQKTENHLAPPFIHQHREQRQFIDARALYQKAFEIRPGRSLWGKGTANDELIKHMSNLPAYLQCINRGDNFQEKVLNVGVLDWTHLEKWNLNQKGDVKRGGIVTASSTGGHKSSNIMNGSSSLPTAVPVKTSTPRRGVKAPLNPLLSSSHIDGSSHYLKPASSKVTHSQDSGSPKIFFNRNKKILPASSSSRRNSAQVTVGEREKRKGLNQETDLNKLKSPAPVKGAIEPCKANIQKSDQEMRNVSDAGTSFSISARQGEQGGPFDGEIREREGKQEGSGIEVSHLPRHRKQKSTVLPLPKRFPQSSIPHMLKKNEKTMPSDPCFTELSWSSFSDSFSSEDLHSGVPFSDIPRSCPLPSQVETQNETVAMTVEQRSHAPSTSSGELHSFLSLKYAKRRGLNGGAASVDLAADLKIESQESPEPGAQKSRNPSPNRRFSFSLGRMTRSFSFKETMSVPQLGPTYISAKSVPVTNHDSSCDTSNQEKANPSSRGRSSPLRRLLDPLLKSKSISSHHAPENIQFDKLVNPSRPLLRGKHEKFTIEALLQLTVKNGNLFFKFVVDNSSDVLAASVSNSVSARKNGSLRSCTFYSVNEIKKKSIGWIGQGNKTKGGDFAYNTVGQMKLSNSPFSDWALKSLNQHDVITTACVLFGVDSRLTDRQPEKFTPGNELAAIVFKFSASPNENEDPNSVTVILPGGVHGLPNEGEPSPLINRWIFGGLCDCGGWDVGCKLHVLSNKNYHCKNTEASKTCSTWDHLELFAEVTNVCLSS